MKIFILINLILYTIIMGYTTLHLIFISKPTDTIISSGAFYTLILYLGATISVIFQLIKIKFYNKFNIKPKNHEQRS